MALDPEMALERDFSWVVPAEPEFDDNPFYRYHTGSEGEQQVVLEQQISDLLGLLGSKTPTEINIYALEEKIADARAIAESTYYNSIGKRLANFYLFITDLIKAFIKNFNKVEHDNDEQDQKHDHESKSLERDPKSDTDSKPEQEPDPNRWFDFDNLYHICLEYLIQRGFTMDLAHLLILNEIFDCGELSNPIFRRQQYYLEKDCEKIVYWDSSLKTQQAYGCGSALDEDYFCAIEAIKKLYSTIVELNGLSGVGGGSGGGGGVGVAVAEEEV